MTTKKEDELNYMLRNDSSLANDISENGVGYRLLDDPQSFPPQIPPRHNNYSSTIGMQSPYALGYNSGMYNGYGGMYNPMTAYSYRGNIAGDGSVLNGVENVTRNAFQSVESVVQAFSSVSMMLESTLFAAQNSIRAIASVADQISGLREHLFNSAYSFIRTINTLLRKLLVTVRLQKGLTPEEIWDQNAAISSSETIGTKHWPLLIFFGIMLGGPWLLWKFLQNLSSCDNVDDWQKGVGEHFLAEAKYNFQAGNRDELSFRKGDIIRIAPKACQPHVRGWLLASIDKKKGLIPANYVQIKGKLPSQPKTFTECDAIKTTQ